MSSKFGKNPRSQNLSFYCVDSCLKVLRNVKTSPSAFLESQIALFGLRSRFTKLCYICYFGAYGAKCSLKKAFSIVPS